MLNLDNDDLYGYGFYKNISIKDRLYEPIARLALQMMSIPAGESSCERAISKARFVCGDHKFNEKNKLKCARILTYISAKMEHG